MQVKVRKLAWVLGGISTIGVVSLVAVACSTTNGDDTPVPGVDSGSRADARPTATGDGSVPVPDGSTIDEDGGVAPDCGRAPTLRSPFPPDAGPDAASNFFCPFGDGGTGSATDKRYCGGEQTCCGGQGSGGSFDSTFCTVAKADQCGAGANGARSRWECGSPENCGGGMKCCIPGTDAGPPAVDTEKVNGKLCPANYQRGFYIGGTMCRNDCAGGELQVCTKDADCTGGKKCVAFSTNNRDLGYCK